jgi:malonyl CoA-acyl carrier protein transacylase
VPFHSQALLSVPPKILKDLPREAISFGNLRLLFPVFSTNDGRDLTTSANLVEDLLLMQCCQPVHWTKALAFACSSNGITHVSCALFCLVDCRRFFDMSQIIDFGPDKTSGKMTARLKEGTGVVLILANSLKVV